MTVRDCQPSRNDDNDEDEKGSTFCSLLFSSTVDDEDDGTDGVFALLESSTQLARTLPGFSGLGAFQLVPLCRNSEKSDRGVCFPAAGGRPTALSASCVRGKGGKSLPKKEVYLVRV